MANDKGRSAASDFNMVRKAGRKDIVLHRATIDNHEVNAISLTHREGRHGALQVTPLFIHIYDVQRMLVGDIFETAKAPPKAGRKAKTAEDGGTRRSAEPELIAPELMLDVSQALGPEVDKTDICPVCGLHRGAILELGCVRAITAGHKPDGCIAA